MSSTTKYQPAPQDEPDDDYTRAPPAYGSSSNPNDATAEAATAGLAAQGLFAHARSSEDNLPDDFKVNTDSFQETTKNTCPANVVSRSLAVPSPRPPSISETNSSAKSTPSSPSSSS